MDGFFDLIRNLKNKLFGKEQKGRPEKTQESKNRPIEPEVTRKPAGTPSEEITPPKIVIPPVIISKPKERDPYFIQIGFDFGTSFSKCICRDIMTNKAWIYTSDKYFCREYPFLIPSVIVYDDEILCAWDPVDEQYHENGLYHLKNAAVKIAQNQWSDPVLDIYKKAIGTEKKEALINLIENCLVYYLSQTLGNIRQDIYVRRPAYWSNKKDHMAVNMAIPVAEAQEEPVIRFFNRILNEAWRLADSMAEIDVITISELESIRKSKTKQVLPDEESPCFIFPEVSANVQGFVRSRVSEQGIYIFSDTGAWTVDQSVFIFSRHDYNECLTYLFGHVLPLGSSNIEYLAAQETGNQESGSLENWRKKKEQGISSLELNKAYSIIRQELDKGTEKTLAHAKMKLRVRSQMNNIKVIFGGGGHSTNPYGHGVLAPFSGHLFAGPVEPEIISIPTPYDLEIKENQKRCLKRLTVAYGLSFEKSELARFIYPKDVTIPSPEELWKPQRVTFQAPDKDEC